MFGKMKEVMEMKKQADKIKRELDSASVETNVVKGIKIVITGSQDFKSIEIDESLIDASKKGRLQADILRSVNAAIKQSQGIAASKMKALMPGGFPGM